MASFQASSPRVALFTACKAKPGLVTSLRFKQHTHKRVICAAILREHTDETARSALSKACQMTIASVLASGILGLSPFPAEADMQMVSPQMVTQMARPLPKQTVDKGKVWSVFIGGAVLLFGVTILAENNEALFPAITRANRAFRMASKQIDEMEERQKKEAELLRLRQAQYDEEQRQLAAVQEGMREARAKVLGSGSSGMQQQQQQPAPPTAAPLMPAAPATATVEASSPGSHSVLVEQASTSVSASSAPYVVVDDAVPDMGAITWPVATPVAAPVAASTSYHADAVAGTAAPTPAANGADAGEGFPPARGAAVLAGDDAEALARLARLQGFVSGSVAGSRGVMEAYKTQRQ